MDVTVALDARYTVATDGSVWSQVGMARGFWERYLDVFDRVRIVARGTRVACAPKDWLPVNSEHILFCGLPDFHGPWECATRYGGLRAAVRSAAHPGAVILRVGSLVANILERKLQETGRPWGLEVVGDPYEVFAPGVVDHPLRPFFRWYFSRRLRRQCVRAAGVAYVTRETLQRRYPTRFLSTHVSDVDLPYDAVLGGVLSTHYSSIELEQPGIANCGRQPKHRGPYQLVTVGSLAQLYKGTDVLIDAVALAVHAGLDVHAIVVGEGQYRPQLMRRAERAGMSARIRFLGQVTAGEPLRRILDSADLFVLPSRTEGLPRALVEAMARALPAVGSAVGGIPELLDAAELVPPADPVALAARIREVLQDPARMEALSYRNLSVALEYCGAAIAERRRSFYRHIRDCTQRWEDLRSEDQCAYSTS